MFTNIGFFFIIVHVHEKILLICPFFLIIVLL